MSDFPSTAEVRALVPEGRKPYFLAFNALVNRQVIGKSAHQSAGSNHEAGDAVVFLRQNKVLEAISAIALAHQEGILEPPLTEPQAEVFGRMADVISAFDERGEKAEFWKIGDGAAAAAELALHVAVDHGLGYRVQGAVRG